VVLLLVLLCLSGFFSSSETALFSLNRSRIASEKLSGRRSWRTVLALLSKPRRLLVSLLVGNTLVNVAAASLGTVVAIELLSSIGSQRAVEAGMLWATVIMTILILFFGEIAPKSFALENAEKMAPVIAGPLAGFAALLGPVRVVLERMTDLLVSQTRLSRLAGPGLSSDELATAVEVGHDEGVVNAFERKIINNILDLETRTAGEVMTPRVEVVSLDIDTPVDEWARAFRESGYSRLPVIEGDLEKIAGVFYAKDYLDVQAQGAARYELRDLLREPYFVPESMKVAELLREFRERQLHFALVIDEYGSVSGLVTMEDVLEEIVGEITDSRDEEEAPFKVIAPGVAVVFAGWELDEFADVTGFPLEDDYAETVGGWLINRLGRIPETGETVNVPPFRFRILSSRPNRVLWVRAEWRVG
jgi:putative hemolysin